MVSASSVEDFNLTQVFDSCEVLTPVQKRRLSKFLKVEENAKVDAGMALVVWVADLLQRLPLPDPDQRWLILEELVNDIRCYGTELAIDLAASNKKTPVFQLGLGDRRYVVTNGRKQLFDLTSGVWIDEPEKPILERILYDLTRLFFYRVRCPRPT